MSDHDRRLTMPVEQAGALLGISRRSAYRAAGTLAISTIRLGRRILVPTVVLLSMLAVDDRNDLGPHDTTDDSADRDASGSAQHHGVIDEAADR